MTADTNDTRLPHTRTSEVPGLLVIACLFTAAGGYMDAFSYLAHGHVFGTAQTANVVLFGVHASGGQWAQATRHLPPIGAFALGVAAAKLLGVRSQKRTFRPTLQCQALEVVILCCLTIFGTHWPNALVVPAISFVAALQNVSFDSIGRWSFNSAITTSNIRMATAGFVLWLMNREPADNRERMIVLSFISLSFALGALGGGFFVRWNSTHALLPCIAVTAAGFLLTWRQRKRQQTHEGAQNNSGK